MTLEALMAATDTAWASLTGRVAELEALGGRHDLLLGVRLERVGEHLLERAVALEHGFRLLRIRVDRLRGDVADEPA